MSNFNPYIKLLRPSNWVKNLIIGFPLLLSSHFTQEAIFNTLIGMVSFSFMASGGYIINDIRDIDKDRQHSKKRNRPLANGHAWVEHSFILALLLMGTSLLINFFLGVKPFLILLTYFVLNYFYSVQGKKIRFVDILLLSSFYIIRIFYGAEIGPVLLTGWFMATITMAVLALSLNKRYMECRNSSQAHIPGRGYQKEDEGMLLNLMFNFTIASIVLLNIHAYFVLAITSATFYFLLNLAAAGIVFTYFDYSKNNSDDPVERVLKNKRLLVMLLFFIILYSYEIIVRK